jgi:hypothetical protein
MRCDARGVTYSSFLFFLKKKKKNKKAREPGLLHFLFSLRFVFAGVRMEMV